MVRRARWQGITQLIGLRPTAVPTARCARGAPTAFDLDVHLIPARKDEPEHEHHDIRFLLRARPGQTITRSDESIDLRWFGADELAVLGTDESVLRLARKASAII